MTHTQTDDVTATTSLSIDECVDRWHALNRADKDVHWQQAEICATLERVGGKRTDVDGGETPVQEFCRRAHISAATFKRLARTFRIFAELRLTSDPRLTDDRLTFKHFTVAATYAKLPTVAITEALEMGWSANALMSFLLRQRGQVVLDTVGSPITPDDDDPTDADCSNWQVGRHDDRGYHVVRESADDDQHDRLPPHTRKVELVFRDSEFAIFAALVKRLEAVLDTDGVSATVLAAVKRAAAAPTRCCPVCGADLPTDDHDGADDPASVR